MPTFFDGLKNIDSNRDTEIEPLRHARTVEPLGVRKLKTDIKDLLGSLQAIQSPGSRIGLPDDPTPVDIADHHRLPACLDNALCAFRDLRSGADYLVSAEVNACHRAVWVRFVQRGPCQDRNGQVEPALEQAFEALRAAAREERRRFALLGREQLFRPVAAVPRLRARCVP